MSDVVFEDYSAGWNDVQPVKVDIEPLHKLEISYDGGRFNVYINNEQVYSNACAGNDFYFTLNVED